MRGLLASLAVFALAGCAEPSRDLPAVDTGTITGKASEPRNRAKLHTELATLYFTRGSMAVALEELRVAVAADPDYASAHNLLGLVYAELRENRLAEASFNRALQLAPADPEVNHNYGVFLCQTGKEADSIRHFLVAARNPLYANPSRSYSAAGLCSVRANKTKEAEEYFVLALRLEPDEPVSLLQLAQIRFGQGRFDEARRLVSRHNRVVESTAESLWLAIRTERKLGERTAEANLASQLRRRFPASREYQALQRGEYD